MKGRKQDHSSERVVCMPQGPDPVGPGRDENPAGEPGDPVPAPDVTAAEEEWLAWCDAAADQDEPSDPDEEDPDSAAPWDYDLDAIIAECRQVTAEETAAAARAARLGLPAGQPIPLARRGPGQPGSARLSPGEYLSRAAGFAAGMVLDTMPGCGALAGFAAEALLELARDLAVKLPGTSAAFRDGILSRYKVQIIACATGLLDPDEARAAEALVLGRAGRLTPGGLRAAIARAVMEVAPA